MYVTRLRQVVVAAHDRDMTESAFNRELGLGTAFHDPGVGDFGLINAVCPVADVFVEVVSPKSDGSPGSGSDSAVGRHLTRHGGDSGYMVIFQVDDIAAARSHLDQLGIRRIWNSDVPEVGASHVHPADIGGAIVSFDEPRPSSSWLWAGPGWEERSSRAATGFAQIEIAATDPVSMLKRWASACNVVPDLDARSFVLPDGVAVGFREPDDSGRLGLVHVGFKTTDGDTTSRASSRTIAGVRFSFGLC